MKNKKRLFTYLFYTAYVLVMLWLLFGQRIDFSALGGEGKFHVERNFIPLKTIRSYIRAVQISSNAATVRHSVINLIGNVIMFIPLGALFPSFWQGARRACIALPSCLFVIILIEIFQDATMLGSLDVDDVILNMLGCAVGYVFYKVFSLLSAKKRPKNDKKCRK